MTTFTKATGLYSVHGTEIRIAPTHEGLGYLQVSHESGSMSEYFGPSGLIVSNGV